MARKVIIDCDPGIDDAVALALALFDPRIEVVAVTACAGTIDAGQATDNVRTLVERLDPPKIPRIGSALDPDLGAAVANGTLLHGESGLGNSDWQPVSRQHTLPSDKLMDNEIRANPNEVTVVCMGPQTTLAKCLGRDKGLSSLIDRVIVAGGTVHHAGDVTATAEFNMHFDPTAARAVFQSPTTKSLLPLDVTSKVRFGLELIEKLPGSYTKVGEVLDELLRYLFRSTRQNLGQESISLQAVWAVLMLVEPMLFEWTTMAGDIEVSGELTRGATVFDCRPQPLWQPNLEVATLVDIGDAKRTFFEALRYADAS